MYPRATQEPCSEKMSLVLAGSSEDGVAPPWLGHQRQSRLPSQASRDYGVPHQAHVIPFRTPCITGSVLIVASCVRMSSSGLPPSSAPAVSPYAQTFTYRAPSDIRGNQPRVVGLVQISALATNRRRPSNLHRAQEGLSYRAKWSHARRSRPPEARLRRTTPVNPAEAPI